MQLVVFNTTGGTLSFLSGQVVVNGGGNTPVTSSFLQLALATDGSFRSNVLSNNVYITDGTNNFGNNDAINYLYELVQNIGPSSDGLGNNLTSTSVNGKQRLNIDLASEGVDGSTSPFSTTQVGGKDGSGNIQTLSTDTTGAVNINNIAGAVSLPTGAATSANQSTEITSLQLIDNPVGSVAAGTAGTSSFLIGGQFNTTLPTLSNTQQAAVQLDSSSRIIISPGLITSTKIALTPISPTAVSVGVATTAAVASNANRKGLVLTNTSTAKISIGIGVSAVLNSGIVLYPGGVWVMDEFNFTTDAVNAIASAAASNLAIQEFNT